MLFEVTLHIIFAIDLANTIKQFAPESYLFVQFNEYHHENRKIIEFSLLYITFRWAVCEPRNWSFGQICRPKMATSILNLWRNNFLVYSFFPLYLYQKNKLHTNAQVQR